MMTVDSRKMAGWIAAPTLAAMAWLAAAQTPATPPVTPPATVPATMPETRQAREIKLLEGRGELLRFDRDLTKVAVAEPKVADAVVISPREVMVNAKGVGRTTVILWLGDGEPQQYEITVTADTSDF